MSDPALERLIAAPGELRAQLLRLLEDRLSQGVDVLLAPPGLLPRPFAGLARLAQEPYASLPRESIYAYQDTLREVLCREVDTLEQRPEWEACLHRWIDALQSGSGRIYGAPDRALYPRVLCDPQRSVFPSGPLTLAGAAREDDPLTLEVRGEAHLRIRRHLAAALEDADDLTDLVREDLLASWAGDLVSPKDVYHRVLTRYFWDVIEGMDDVHGDDNPLREQLTEFQEEAYFAARGILQRYGGVFLADVVGLGKTFIGLALLLHLQRRYERYAVVIAPPNVCPTWKTLAEEFKIQLVTVSMGKLSDLEQYDDRSVLLIDESHNFRNTGTQRYDTISAWLRPGGLPSTRQTILLSATPQNNDVSDVRNQLALFPDNYARLPYTGESLDGWIRDVRHGQADPTQLLQQVVVRRTRRFVKETYPGATLRRRLGPGTYEHVPLHFPDRISGEAQCLRYSIDAEYGGSLYSDILGALRSMSYALYGLGQFVLPAFADDPRVAGIRKAGNALRGLYKVLLLKRLESSVPAFIKSLEHLVYRLMEAIELLEQGSVVVKRLSERPPEPEDLSEDPLTFYVHEEVPAALFDTARLRSALEGDFALLEPLLESVAAHASKQDVKLDRLIRYLSERPPEDHKTLIFTQFADTAEHLFDHLKTRFEATEIVTGSRGNALRAARRFAPRANRQPHPSAEARIDLLITTDTLSEGVNLQDADTLINYDIHWNPVRLIQRAGRIDRIGTEHQEVHISSFLPEKGLEDHLGVEGVLRHRIDEFLKVFGEDSRVLPTDDRFDEEGAVAAYTGAALEGPDDHPEMDGLGRHINRLMTLRREGGEDYARVLELRPGRRSLSTLPMPPLVALQQGRFWGFYAGEHSEAVKLPDLKALDLLHEAAEAGSAPPSASHGPLRLRLGQAAELARAAFAPEAERYRDQRTHPRLTPSDDFLIRQLTTYQESCVASRRPLVEEMCAWVRSGNLHGQLARRASSWKRANLPPPSVFAELRPIFTQLRGTEEDLGEVEIAGVVGGVEESRVSITQQLGLWG